MKMRHGAMLVLFLLCVTPNFAFAQKHASLPPGVSVLSENTFQSYVYNWMGASVLAALVQKPEQFQQIFHPAPIMGDKRPFKPEPGFYNRNALLVVSRLVQGDPLSAAFTVESCTLKRGTLRLELRQKHPDPGGSATFKTVFLLSVPQDKYREITITLDGKKVASLNPEAGRWLVPTASDVGH